MITKIGSQMMEMRVAENMKSKAPHFPRGSRGIFILVACVEVRLLALPYQRRQSTLDLKAPLPSKSYLVSGCV